MTAASASTVARPIVVGANHRSSSLALRDQLFVDDAAAPAFLAALRNAGLSQAMVLSTCDRVEVLAIHHDVARAHDAAVAVLAARAGLPESDLDGQLYTLTGAEAVKHVFAVAASLDSLVIGEPHVLGQVKASHQLSRDAGLSGSELEALVQAALGAAKRVRSETAIGEGPVSIASAAVQFARDLHGELKNSDGLLIGAGDMGELVAEAFLAAGLKRLVVTAPRLSRAETLAKSLDCHVAPFEELSQIIADADVVITALGSRHTVIGSDLVTAALKKRRRKPVFIVDAGIPGDVEPAVNRIDGAFLYDLTDLERAALEGRSGRETAARAAWAIIEAEVASHLKSRAARTAVPAIAALRQRFEDVRAQAVAEAGGDADKATRLLIHRLLHDPSEAMKEIASRGDAGLAEWNLTEAVLRRLFRLDGGKE